MEYSTEFTNECNHPHGLSHARCAAACRRSSALITRCASCGHAMTTGYPQPAIGSKRARLAAWHADRHLCLSSSTPNTKTKAMLLAHPAGIIRNPFAPTAYLCNGPPQSGPPQSGPPQSRPPQSLGAQHLLAHDAAMAMPLPAGSDTCTCPRAWWYLHTSTPVAGEVHW